MKSIYLLILASFFIFFLQSCNEEGIAGEIKLLQTDCNNTLVDVEGFEPTVFPIEDANEYLSIMMPYFESFDKASLKTLVDLANTEKASRKVNLDNSELIKELSYSKTQITALYNEFKSDSLTKELALQYFENERQTYTKLKIVFDSMEDSNNRLKNNFERLIPKAKHIVDSLDNLTLK